MKSDSELMNELSKRVNYLHELNDDERVALKKVLLEIFVDVSALCKKHNLTIMMSGGTCLGTVRHQGFIPWDDDLDVMMPRGDYEMLIKLLEKGELGDKYEYSAPNKNADSNTVFLKIFRKNSLNVELFNENSPFNKGIYIDIFALDAVPTSKIGQFVKGFFANALQFCAILTLYAQFPSKSLREFMCLDKNAKRRYYLKFILGKLISIIPHQKWVYWFDCFVADERDNGLLGIPTGRKYYNGEIFQKNVYLPTTTATFEGIEVQIPGKYDEYLRNLYGNYMQLPPVEKRERHFILQFKMPEA